MDLKQALQQRSSACTSSLSQHKNPPSSSPSYTTEGGNLSSCSNSTNTAEDSNHAGTCSSPADPHHLVSSSNPSAVAEILTHHGSSPSRPLLFSDTAIAAAALRRPSELTEADHNTRVLKLARFHDPPSPHSTLETQALINLHGINSCTGFTDNSSTLPFFSNSASNSNHPSASTNYQCSSTLHSNLSLQHSNCRGQQLAFSFNGGSASSAPSPLSKSYPFASLEESRLQNPLLLSATTSSPSQAAASNQARNQYLASLSCLNPGPSSSIFTPEQLIELTQQTYVFKHFAAGVTPPNALLLPIINSVASSISRAGAGPLHFGINAGLYNVGPLRGHVDLEPGRCRRTDGKKWRCAREVVPDQKYCERHMHRGRHRARGKLNAMAGAPVPINMAATTTATVSTADPSPNPAQLSSQNALIPVNTSSNATVKAASVPVTASNPLPSVVKESQLQFSLQQPASRDASRSLGAILSNTTTTTTSLASRNVEQPPILADLLNETSSSSAKLNVSHLTSNPKSHPAFPFNCQSGDRDADNLVFRHLAGPDWPIRTSRGVADPPPPPPTLSWIDQLAEEQNKRSRFNSELSMASQFSNPSLRSPLSLSSKFGGDQHEDIGDTPNYMGLSIAASSKPKEDDGYGTTSRNTWVPITWDNPSIGGPLGEALQANGTANSGGNFSDSLPNTGGDGCLNLIEESWDHDEHVSRSPVKDRHSHSLASPTGVLQMKASFGSYSDSSSSASSPRSALKLESAANLAI